MSVRGVMTAPLYITNHKAIFTQYSTTAWPAGAAHDTVQRHDITVQRHDITLQRHDIERHLLMLPLRRHDIT